MKPSKREQLKHKQEEHMEEKNNVVELTKHKEKRRVTLTVQEDDRVCIDVYHIDNHGEILGIMMGSLGVIAQDLKLPFEKMNELFTMLLDEWYPEQMQDKNPDVTVEALELACDIAMLKKAEGIEDLAERQAAVVAELAKKRDELVKKTGFTPKSPFDTLDIGPGHTLEEYAEYARDLEERIYHYRNLLAKYHEEGADA